MSSSNFKIKITEQAEIELDNVFLYISQVFSAKGTANIAVNKIVKGIMQLSEMPHSAPLLSKLEYTEYGIRKLVIDQYGIFYIINEKLKQVEIIHILHGAQDYTKKI